MYLTNSQWVLKGTIRLVPESLLHPNVGNPINEQTVHPCRPSSQVNRERPSSYCCACALQTNWSTVRDHNCWGKPKKTRVRMWTASERSTRIWKTRTARNCQSSRWREHLHISDGNRLSWPPTSTRSSCEPLSWCKFTERCYECVRSIRHSSTDYERDWKATFLCSIYYGSSICSMIISSSRKWKISRIHYKQLWAL